MIRDLNSPILPSMQAGRSALISQNRSNSCKSSFGNTTERLRAHENAVDGKSACGSRDRRRARSALHMVSDWACRNRLVLGHEATEEKSNEITAIPKLLELLEVKGCIVTIDAMGCQRAIAAQIITQGGNYVLGLKGNQCALQGSVEDFFEVAAAGYFAAVTHDFRGDRQEPWTSGGTPLLDHRGLAHAA